MLVVSAVDHKTALAQIHQYRLENRYWRWRKPVFQQDLFFDWSSFVWVSLNIFFYAWSESHPVFRAAGIMDAAAVVHGEWWRLFTATWLHADLAHLAANLLFGFLFLGLVMGRYGPGVGLLAAYVAGVVGNGFTWLVYDQTHRGLGASGVVMGGAGFAGHPIPAHLKTAQLEYIQAFCRQHSGRIPVVRVFGDKSGNGCGRSSRWIHHGLVARSAADAGAPAYPTAVDQSHRRNLIRRSRSFAMVVGNDARSTQPLISFVSHQTFYHR